jgi:acyl dehydratase
MVTAKRQGDPHVVGNTTLKTVTSLERRQPAGMVSAFTMNGATLSSSPRRSRTSDLFHRIVGHGKWSGLLISSALGTKLPRPGTNYISQDLRFIAPISLAETVTTAVTM